MKMKTGWILSLMLSAGCGFSQIAANHFDSGGGTPPPKTIYVPANEPKTLQLIVDDANPGDEIIVAAGVYDMGGRRVGGLGPATRLVIDKPLTLRSEEGAAKTFLMGGPSTRCLYLTNGAEVIGFTITGGETMEKGPEGNKFTALSGGGVWSEPAGMITDCVVVSNKALWFGGGMYGGNASRCVFRYNEARRSGGGASRVQLGSCELAYNRAARFGGGAHQSDLYNCTVAHNRAEVMGGGVAYGSGENSVIHHNQTLLGNHNYFRTKLNYSSSWPKPPGRGNLGTEPGFKNTDAGVFSLKYSSPVIDQGTNSWLTADLIGVTRSLDGNNNKHSRPDMGAYEFVHPQADSNGDGLSDLEEFPEQKMMSR